jgi:hypothetical protein
MILIFDRSISGGAIILILISFTPTTVYSGVGGKVELLGGQTG